VTLRSFGLVSAIGAA